MLDVIVDAAHDLARRAVFKVADREALERGEHLAAQIVDDLLLQRIVETYAQRSGQVLPGLCEQEATDQPRQKRNLVLPDDIIDDQFHQPGRQELQRRRGPGRSKRERCQSPVRADIAKDT